MVIFTPQPLYPPEMSPYTNWIKAGWASEPVWTLWRGSLSRCREWNSSSPGPYLSVYGFTVLLLDLCRFFSFLILYTFGRTPWTGDEPVTKPLPTHRTAQTQNKRTQTSMPWMGFEPAIPAFERSTSVHALDRTATVIGIQVPSLMKILTGLIVSGVFHVVTKLWTADIQTHTVYSSMEVERGFDNPSS
jgi:hypothetical protein